MMRAQTQDMLSTSEYSLVTRPICDYAQLLSPAAIQCTARRAAQVSGWLDTPSLHRCLRQVLVPYRVNGCSINSSFAFQSLNPPAR